MHSKKTRQWLGTALLITVLLVLIAGVLFPLFATAKTSGGPDHCRAHLQQLALSTVMYRTDNDERLPPAATWADAMGALVKNKILFTCGRVRDRRAGQFGHAFHASLGLKSATEIPNLANEVVIFDSSDLSWNANGSLSLLPPIPRGTRKVHGIAFLVGDARYLTVRELLQISTGLPIH